MGCHGSPQLLEACEQLYAEWWKAKAQIRAAVRASKPR
jgi:hypothetical protein